MLVCRELDSARAACGRSGVGGFPGGGQEAGEVGVLHALDHAGDEPAEVGGGVDAVVAAVLEQASSLALWLRR